MLSAYGTRIVGSRISGVKPDPRTEFLTLRLTGHGVATESEQRMYALKGYFDESGDERDAQHAALSVAGYVGATCSWPAFEERWQGVLKEFDVPYLHMRELQHRRGAFAAWAKSDPKADVREASFLGKLAGAIGEAGLEPFGAAISLSGLRRFNVETGAGLDAKALAIYGCVLDIRRRHAHDTINLVFDRMDGGSATVELAKRYAASDSYYPDARNFPVCRILPKGGPEGSRNTPGLQAADFLAWEVRKNYVLKREWLESDVASPDSQDWDNSLFKWWIKDRIEHMQKNNIKELPLGLDMTRRSLSALGDAAPADQINGIIWMYRTLVRAHEVRKGNWSAAPAADPPSAAAC